MNILRIVLLGLAAFIFVALGWRLTGLPIDQRSPRPPIVAANPPKVAPPSVTAPMVPAVPAPAVSPTVPAPLAAPEPSKPAATALGSAPASTPPPLAPDTTAAPAPSAAPSAVPAPPSAPDTASSTPITGDAAILPTPGLPADAARRAIEAQLRTAPDLVHVFDVMAKEFPAVAARSMNGAVDALRLTGQLPTPDDFVAGAMRDARLSAGVLAARAGPEALQAIFETKAATLADLEAADPRICADYVYGGTSPEFNDFAVTHRALVARTDIATLAAMADGRSRQMNWETPSADDYALIEAALKAKGLSADEIGAVLDGKGLETPPSDTRLCDNARAYLDAMRAMPLDARNRVYGLAAELLARS